MINFENLLLTESLHAKLLCNTDECLSYILVLLNLLTVFYLVYSSYRKVNKITRVFGYVWSCFIMCAAVTVLFFHTCIFTIMCTVFTGMGIIAVLSMIFEAKQEEKRAQNQLDYGVENTERDKGSYVIYKTDDDKYAFALHAKNKKLLLKSVYKYATIDDAKNAILICRENGLRSGLQNTTGDLILDVNHPKFRLYVKNGSYFVDLAIDKETVLLKSSPIEFSKDAIWYANESMKFVNSKLLYLARGKDNIVKGEDYLEAVEV